MPLLPAQLARVIASVATISTRRDRNNVLHFMPETHNFEIYGSP
jgi:hypothetical protein